MSMLTIILDRNLIKAITVRNLCVRFEKIVTYCDHLSANISFVKPLISCSGGQDRSSFHGPESRSFRDDCVNCSQT